MKSVVPALTVSVAFALIGCTVGEDYKKADPQGGVPTQWVDDPWRADLEGIVSGGKLDPAVLAEWWKTLGDPVLTSLIDRAAVANLDLRRAATEVRRARGEREVAVAGGSPTVGATGGVSRTGRGDSSATAFSSGLDAGWEADLFGGIARSVEAADAGVQAAEELRRDVLVTTLAEVALNYADFCTAQRRLELASANASMQERTLEIVQDRMEVGRAQRLDVDQARANFENSNASIAPLHQSVSQTANRLSVLLGENPGSLNAELLSANPRLSVPDVAVAVGVPADVLRRRPDVRARERELAAATARVGVAVAELYPKLRFSGTVGLESPSLSSLFTRAGSMFSFGPNVEWNLFDGGATRARIEIQNAAQELALVNYEEAVLLALEEVENAITAFVQEQLRRESLVKSNDAATSAAKIAMGRYEAGATSFLEVLDAQRSLCSIQDQLAVSDGEIVVALIRLYKALGGGWNPEPPSQSDASPR